VSATAIVAVTAVIVVWGAVAGRLERIELTAPMVLTVIGGTFAAVGLVDAREAPPAVQPLVELTLVWVLFADAHEYASTTCATTSAGCCASWASACR
jgi:hypothetical protein